MVYLLALKSRIYCSKLLFFNGKRVFTILLLFKRSLSTACPVIVNMNPRNRTILLLLPASLFLLSSCITNAFFHSPMQGNNNAYHATPLGSDSVKSATYVDGAASLGGMNEDLRDGVYAFQLGLHRAHALGAIRFNYGATLALGSYHVDDYYHSYNSYYSNGYVPGGNLFFGAYGLQGGVSASMPLGRRGEWRYLGVEGSLFKEFGDYYSFRKNLADTLAEEIDRKKYLGSVGLNTEIIFKSRRSGNKFGIKIGVGSYLRQLSYYDSYSSNYSHKDDLIYFSSTYHFTFRKSTIYFQFNGATHAAHFQVGYNFRL